MQRKGSNGALPKRSPQLRLQSSGPWLLFLFQSNDDRPLRDPFKSGAERSKGRRRDGVVSQRGTRSEWAWEQETEIGGIETHGRRACVCNTGDLRALRAPGRAWSLAHRASSQDKQSSTRVAKIDILTTWICSCQSPFDFDLSLVTATRSKRVIDVGYNPRLLCRMVRRLGVSARKKERWPQQEMMLLRSFRDFQPIRVDLYHHALTVSVTLMCLASSGSPCYDGTG